MTRVSRSRVEQLIGQEIYALKRDGTVVRGRLVRLNGNELIVEPTDGKARTNFFIPLVLFDLLAIGLFDGFSGGFWW